VRILARDLHSDDTLTHINISKHSDDTLTHINFYQYLLAMLAARFPAFRRCPEILCRAIPEVDWQKVYRDQTPYVIRGLVGSWPAVQSDGWIQSDSLKQRVGTEECMVPVEFGGDYMDDNMQKMLVNFPDLLNFLDSADADNASDQVKAASVYLAQYDLRQIPNLIDDVSPPPEIVSFTGKQDTYAVNIWLGGRAGTSSPCHYDPFNNVLCQIYGQKEVLLFHPDMSRRLYPAYDTTQRNTSRVNFRQRVDDDEYPMFKDVEGYEVTLEPGDALFVPFKWWHYCETNQRSCSVNYWWL
jgi:lysine-specific demethylase 8